MKAWNVLVPDGYKFGCNLDPVSARAAAQEMGAAAEICRDLARPDGPNIAAGIGRDGEWLRAFVASDSPLATGINWLELAVSPVTEESIHWLISVVSMVVDPDPKTVRLV